MVSTKSGSIINVADTITRTSKEKVKNPVPLPAHLKLQKILTYDESRFPFRALVADILGVNMDKLGQIHKNSVLAEKELKQKKKNRGPYSKRWKVAIKHSHFQKIRALVARFALEFCAPALETDAVVFQTVPTFRIHIPGTKKSLGKRHTDYQYFHQKGEVNFWIPLTKVFGTNSLWTESVPRKGDFGALEADVGQVVQFYGNQCEHYTTPNEEDVTRVSLDFRVIPFHCYIPLYIPLRKKNRVEPPFKLGQYYSLARSKIDISSTVNDVVTVEDSSENNRQIQNSVLHQKRKENFDENDRTSGVAKKMKYI